MVIPAVDSVGATASGKKETVESSSFFVEEVGSGIAYVEFRVAPGQGSLLIFFVFGTDILAVPEVILFVSFLVGVVIG